MNFLYLDTQILLLLTIQKSPYAPWQIMIIYNLSVPTGKTKLTAFASK